MTHRRPRLESSIERQAVEHAHRRGIDAIKLNLQGRRGWPDRLFLLPGGRPLFIEFKRTVKKKPDPLQARVHARLRKLGYRVLTCGSVEDAERAIDGAL